MRKFSSTLSIIAIFLLFGLAVNAKAESTEVSPQEAATLQSENKAVIVDVREDDEWEEQHIDGAIHIPLAQISTRLKELKNDPNKPIITQCQAGGRSAKAQEILKSAGFSKVYNMEGGLQAWNKAGLATKTHSSFLH